MACLARPLTPIATQAAKTVFAKYPGIKILAEGAGMWSQAVGRQELSKIVATHPWSEIDGVWMQTGCNQAETLMDEAGIPDDKKKPCAGGRRQWVPCPIAAEGYRSPRR